MQGNYWWGHQLLVKHCKLEIVDLSELTHGFEDNFVEVWNRAPKPDPHEEGGDDEESHCGAREKEPPWSPTANDKDFFFDDEEDPVFKTVPGEYSLG